MALPSFASSISSPFGKDEGSLCLRVEIRGRGEVGGRCTAVDGRTDGGQDATAKPGEPRQSPDLHHYPLNPAEARTCINYLVDRGGTYPASSTAPPRAPPMSNDQLHHTSHSRYIRRHNVGVRAQHAPSSRSPSSPLVLATLLSLFGALGRRNLLIAKVRTRKRRAGERDRETEIFRVIRLQRSLE